MQNNSHSILQKFKNSEKFQGIDGKYHYVYMIHDLPGKGGIGNSRYYIGKHSHKLTKNKYKGSGGHLNKIYAKYNCYDIAIKTILKCYNSCEESLNGEKEILEDLYSTDSLCVNLCAGGLGMSPNQETKNKRKATMASKTEEEKQNIRDKQSISNKVAHNKMSFIEKQEIGNKISISNKATYAAKTLEEKKKLSNKKKATIANRTKERQKEISDKQKIRLALRTKEDHLIASIKKKATLDVQPNFHCLGCSKIYKYQKAFNNHLVNCDINQL